MDSEHAPLIIDTDLGGNPDDAFAVAIAALTVPELALVITTDELAGERARFARHLLDLLGRPEVPVVSGADLGNTRYFCVEDLTPASMGRQPADVAAAVEAVRAAGGPVRWLGLGPASNLAALLTVRPDLTEHLVVTQMGGALRQRDQARLLTAHFDRWADRVHPASLQHDVLALAAALGWPGITFGRERVAIDGQARMRRDPHGIELTVSVRVGYGAFMGWLETGLTGRHAPAGSRA